MVKNLSVGYTLLELLVVLSIIALVFSGGFASYREYQKRQNLEGAVRLVKSDLRLAQEYALAGKKPTNAGNPCLTSSLDGYTFEKVGSNDIYAIKAVCGNSAFEIKSVDLSLMYPGIHLQPFPIANTLTFKVLARGTLNTNDTEIELKDPGATSVKIIVTQVGEIYESQ